MTQNIETCIERHSIGSGCPVKRLIPYLLIDILVTHSSRSGIRQIVAICGLRIIEASLTLTVGTTVGIKRTAAKPGSTAISWGKKIKV